jgi:hypothetical protein
MLKKLRAGVSLKPDENQGWASLDIVTRLAVGAAFCALEGPQCPPVGPLFKT